MTNDTNGGPPLAMELTVRELAAWLDARGLCLSVWREGGAWVAGVYMDGDSVGGDVERRADLQDAITTLMARVDGAT